MLRHSRRHQALAVALSVAAFSQPLSAEDDVRFSGVRRSQIIEEVAHPFSVYTYSTPFEISETTDLTKMPAPERAVAEWLRAMQRGSYDAAFASWDADSQKRITERNAQQRKTKQDWEKEWSNVYRNKPVVLKQRIVYGEYMLVPYWFAEDRDRVEPAETATLKKEQDTWKVTLELAANPVLTSWTKPGTRVQRLPDAFYQTLMRNAVRPGKQDDKKGTNGSPSDEQKER